MAGRALVVAGAVVAAGWLISRAADMRARQAGADIDATGPEQPDTDQEQTGETVLDIINPWGAIGVQVDRYQASSAAADDNVRAFLSLIEWAEGTARGGRDPYRTCYAYRHTIKSFADHPAVTGEWRGEPLPDAMCRGAGLKPGCVSTAAGRYQLIRPTWVACKRALGLQDFGPESQDAAAVHLIKQRGALDDVRAGRVTEAVEKCRREWASLPGAGYGQGERRMADLVAVYERAGGALA